MKIFIWDNPYGVLYGKSFLFVAAENEEQARARAKDALVVPYGIGRPERLLGDQIVLGEPTRVIEAPGGECYEWSE